MSDKPMACGILSEIRPNVVTANHPHNLQRTKPLHIGIAIKASSIVVIIPIVFILHLKGPLLER